MDFYINYIQALQLSKHTQGPMSSDKQGSTVHINVCVSMCTCVCMYAEPEIAVGHWPFSDQFQDLAEQK